MKSRIIDRHFPGIGRVRRASGTSDLSTHRAIGAMFTMLVKKGRLDLVRAWADGIIHAMDLYDRYRTEKLALLPSAESMRPLWTVDPKRPGAADAHLATIKNHHTATSVRHTWAALKALPRGESATIADIPMLVDSFRRACEQAGHPRMFTNGRNNVRAFLRATVGTSHPLYLAVKEIQPLPLGHTPGRPFTRTTLATFLTAMREQHGDYIADVARSLALSGMRPEEYWGEWQQTGPHVITVRTAKQRTGSKPKYRQVFTVCAIVRAGRGASRQTFEKKFRQVTTEHEPYDLRRTFMHLMEQARIPRSRRRMYLGHAVGDVGDLYEEHEVADYLRRDRKRLLRYLRVAQHA